VSPDRDADRSPPADPAPGVPTDSRTEPEALTPAAVGRLLRTAVLGHRIVYYPSIGSTNDRALELASEGDVEGTLVLAEEQTGGRGRRQRAWFSPPRLGIYATLLLRPAIPAARAPLFTFLAAVAVARALRETSGLEARIEWPNDVVIARRKLAGVLGEMRGSGPTLRELVVGIGINVHQRPEDFPPALRPRATSIRNEGGAPCGRAAILASFLEEFERRYARLLKDGPATLLAEWEGLSAFPRGCPVVVRGPGGTTEGTITGVDEEGALRLLGSRGAEIRVPFGEIIEAGGA
jgi:BirA family biotin operon repressor/biotin-[acetyl-CoA-carboxylase] ligase